MIDSVATDCWRKPAIGALADGNGLDRRGPQSQLSFGRCQCVSARLGRGAFAKGGRSHVVFTRNQQFAQGVKIAA